MAFFVFCYQLANLNGVSLAMTGALLCALLAGACAGFLPHNFYPARLFMGDSGSMLLGLMLSASALTLTGQFAVTDLTQGGGGSEASLLPTLLPIIAAAVDPGRAVRGPGAGRRTTHPARADRSSTRTSSTCTTGCSRSGTRTAARC